MKLVLKLDENGKPVTTEDGKIIYIDSDDGDKEYPLDGAAMYVKILNLGTENKQHRERAKAAEDKLKVLDGIEGIDPENPGEWVTTATKALATVKNLDDKQLVDAGKIDEVKQEMRDAYENQLTAKDQTIELLKTQHTTEIGTKDDQIMTIMRSGKFNSSRYFVGVDGNLSVTSLPPDAAEALFGKHFKVEVKDGKPRLKAYAEDGKTELLSKVNPGEPADFDEAIGLIIDKYPHKDSIIRPTGSGSGSGGGQGSQAPVDEMSKLEAQLAQAQKDGNAPLMITVRNRIFDLKNSKKPA